MPAEIKPSATITDSFAVAKGTTAALRPAARNAEEAAAVIRPAASMKLAARAFELQRVLEYTEVTDITGKPRGLEEAINELLHDLKTLRSRGNRLYLVGNGGSASVASHAVTDFLNVAKLRAATLHDPSLITCMSNDYGYEAAFQRILSTLAEKGDMLITISSSGRSANVRFAATEMRQRGGSVVTLSGFQPDNPLRSTGDLNFWLNSTDYGMVEIGHQFILHNVADRLRLGM